MLSNFAQRFTTEMESYSQEIIAQFKLYLRESKKFEHEQERENRRKNTAQ
jgi:hypothetical protein